MSRSQSSREARRAAREIEPGQPKPPYHIGFRWDYENARRAGRTHPDLVEIIGANDLRHVTYWAAQPNNRAARRAHGVRGGQATIRKSSRRRPARAVSA